MTAFQQYHIPWYTSYCLLLHRIWRKKMFIKLLSIIRQQESTEGVSCSLSVSRLQIILKTMNHPGRPRGRVLQFMLNGIPEYRYR